jgi:hypothetical protein
VLLLAVIAAGGLIAACGSSSSSSTTTQAAASGSPSSASGSGSPRSARRAALVACLKQHGVTLPARRPGAGGGGFFGGGGPPAGGTSTTGGRGFFRDPKMQAALKACGANFGNFRGGRGLGRQRITNYVTCVRQHGYNMPNPNFSGNGPIFPASIRSDPKFQAASRNCQSLLVRPGAGTSGGAGTGGSNA